MAALTANKDVDLQEPRSIDHPVAAATKIYAGALTCVNASHQAVPAADTAGLKFVGIAKKPADNSAGAAGDKDVVVHRDYVAKLPTAATFAVGDIAHVLDDQTVTTAALATNDVAVGRVVKVVSGFVFVDIRDRA